MFKATPLVISIFRSVLFFELIHGGVFAILTLFYNFLNEYRLVYVLSCIGLSGLVLSVLVYARDQFYLIENRQPLTKINCATHLTLFRITSLPTILVLFVASEKHVLIVPLVVYVALAFLSDLLDGFISRVTRQVTRMGQYLDSMGDYAILIGISFIFVWYKFVPVWFFVIIITRFLTQWALMLVLFLVRKGVVEPRSSLLGKASVACCMGCFALSLLTLFPSYEKVTPLLVWVDAVVTLILLASLIEKIIVFWGELQLLIARKE